MKIEVTTSAKDYLQHYLQPNDQLTFVYTHMGCTCSEEGQFSLQASATVPQEATAVIDSNIGEIHIDPSKQTYLDKEMTLDFNKDYQGLQLTGKYEGLITPRLIIVDDKGQQILKH